MRPYTPIRLITQLTRQYSTAAKKPSKSSRWFWYFRNRRTEKQKKEKLEASKNPDGSEATKNPSGPSLPGPPRTIICIGRNYAGHIAELGGTRPKEPFFFLKPATSLLLPPPERGRDTPKIASVLMPKGCDLQYEVELAVVVSKKLDEWKGGLQNLKDVVWGYKVAIDITARNHQSAAKEKGLPWSLAKGFKSFCPVSKLIPVEQIPDPHNVQLHLEVNGTQKQEDSTSLMLFDIPRLLRHVSSVMPLGPGDLLLTGTPKGVGSVKPGDKITAGLRVDGKELELGKITLQVKERSTGYGSEADKEVIEKGPKANEQPPKAKMVGKVEVIEAVEEAEKEALQQS